MEKLQTGEKYLSIVLLGNIRVVAFPNKNRKKETEPNFKGDGVAVWISTKKETPLKPKEELI